MTFREMMVDDLDQVMEIEEDVFAVPWTKERISYMDDERCFHVFRGGKRRGESWVSAV